MSNTSEVRDWAVADTGMEVHRFRPDQTARCNPYIYTHASPYSPDTGQGRAYPPTRWYRTLEEIRRSRFAMTHEICSDCTGIVDEEEQQVLCECGESEDPLHDCDAADTGAEASSAAVRLAQAYAVPAVRDRALELAVRSLQGLDKNMTDVTNRAHYFAHYLVDEDRSAWCNGSRDCPFQVTQVPERMEQF